MTRHCETPPDLQDGARLRDRPRLRDDPWLRDTPRLRESARVRDGPRFQGFPLAHRGGEGGEGVDELLWSGTPAWERVVQGQQGVVVGSGHSNAAKQQR